jgi:hypothetical protein
MHILRMLLLVAGVIPAALITKEEGDGAALCIPIRNWVLQRLLRFDTRNNVRAACI